MYFAAQIAELSGARALFLYIVHESSLPWATFAVILAALQTLTNSLKNNVHCWLVHSTVSIHQSILQQGYHAVLQRLQGQTGISENA